MNAEQHQRAMQLFQDALERDRSQRDAFLRQACGDDHALLAEVESLLAHHRSQTLIIPRVHAVADLAGQTPSSRRPCNSFISRIWRRADRRGLRAGLIALILALALFGLCRWLSQGIQRTLRNNLAGQLQATLGSNVAAVTNWLELQQSEITKWANHPTIRENFPAIVQLSGSSESTIESLRQTALHQEVVEVMSPLLQRDDVLNVHGTSRSGLLVLEAREGLHGRPSVSAQGAKLASSVLLGQAVLLPPLRGRSLVEHGDLLHGDVPILLIGSPIRDMSEQIVGGLFVGMDSGRDFTHLLSLGRAGPRSDTFAFGPQGQLLSESHYQDQLKSIGLIDDSPEASSVLQVKLLDPGVDLTAGYASKRLLSKRPLTRMASAAIAGTDGIDLDGYRDFRGVQVVGAWQWIEDYGFGVATEIEYDEAFAALNHVQHAFWVLYSLLATSAGLAFLFALSAAQFRRKAGEARQLGMYTLEQLIGRGGMGKVYRASHAMLRRPTAVKVLDGEHANQAAVDRFEREVQIASSLSHPNTVEIYDYGRTEDNVFYYAMEYLPGIDLEKFVRREGAIGSARVLHILRQVLGSLAEAHGRGLIHRDIKPANVILCQRGGISDFVKVVDFGLAKDPSYTQMPQITQTGSISGTPIYIAPECLKVPPELSPSVDIYAVGALAFYLLTGRELFTAPNRLQILRDVMNKPAQRPSDVAPASIPPALDELVDRCLSKEPADRPASAQDMLASVDSIAADYAWSEEDADRWWEQFHGQPSAPVTNSDNDAPSLSIQQLDETAESSGSSPRLR
jgi:serine/threonine protein kinase